MSGFFAPITTEDLKAKLEKADPEGIKFPFVRAKVQKDLEKVDFNLENCTDLYIKKGYGTYVNLMGFHTIDNGLTFYGGVAGGDWQMAVYFLIYFDGKALRGYVPEGGNAWNTDTKRAYGDDEGADARNILNRFGVDLSGDEDGLEGFEIPDAERLIIEDIKSRILPQPATLPISQRIESLKLYGTGDEGVELFDATCSLCYQMSGLGSPEQAETLYRWAAEQAKASEAWKDEDPDDFKMGHWGY